MIITNDYFGKKHNKNIHLIDDAFESTFFIHYYEFYQLNKVIKLVTHSIQT